MDFTNVDDPVGIKSLLDSLRAAQDEPLPSIHPPPLATASVLENQSIASLLSQLNPSTLDTISSLKPLKPEPSKLSFQQSLPYLTALVDNSEARTVVIQLMKDQVHVEQMLWDERVAITSNFQEKLNLLAIRANIVGATDLGIEVERINTAYKTALRKHDKERVLPTWDAIVEKQQTELERLGVPAMFSTQKIADRDRQQKVLSVLQDLVSS